MSSADGVDDLLDDRRNSIILHAGQLYLTIRKKKPRDWLTDPTSSTPPEDEAPPPDSPEKVAYKRKDEWYQ